MHEELRMTPDEARGAPPKQADILEALAERIATIDPNSTFGLVASANCCSRQASM
jgi:hypothetical protein